MKKYLCSLIILSAFILTGCNISEQNSVKKFEKDMINIQKNAPGYIIVGTGYGPDGYKEEAISYIKGNKWRDIVNGHVVISNGKESFILTKEGYKKNNIPKSYFSGCFTFWESGRLKKHFIDENANINGMTCKKIGYGPNDAVENCISNEYGIAIYQKINKSDINPALNGMHVEIKKVKVTDIPDSVFELR